MKRTMLFAVPVLAILLAFVLYAEEKEQLYKSTEGSVSFFSVAPIENIDATSKNIISIINTSTNEIVFDVAIKSFQFKRAKMQTDFNENFMNSAKYPVATYKGKINEKISWDKSGMYKVTSKGILTIHGVAKERTDTATIRIRGGLIRLESKFFVRVADHDIKVPTLLYKHIAEVVSVKLNMSYSESKNANMISASDK
jgi:hypothetical protein